MNSEPEAEFRSLHEADIDVDFVIAGGGVAGTCAAITAARQGLRVALVQDRPVLGGNASSEVRLWCLGATSHMGSNNRWAREGGVADEILVENMWRNKEGNAYIFDTILLEKVTLEPNITLLLNTSVFKVEKAQDGSHCIKSITAFCSQNSTLYNLTAPLFCDSSGDGIVGFLAGAAFRMGAEGREEFGEKFAPNAEYGELLGHSMYFYAKDVGKPVRYVAPAYAYTDIEQRVPRFTHFNDKEHGCRLWWIEYGGRLDTVHDTEKIKWELWRVVYGVWNYIKNSGKFPDAENLALEWVSTIPGKRESRRFEGDYMLRQQDVIDQTAFPDVVSFGGWSIDLHPADGVFSEKPGCNQWHSRGIYGIPYRCYYSRNIPNLFLSGRIISVSHVAFGSSRVILTCSNGAQAVAVAAALCLKYDITPRELGAATYLQEFQTALLRTGQHVPALALHDPSDLALTASITATSELKLSSLPAGGPDLALKRSWAMLLPAAAGPAPIVTFTVDASVDTSLEVQLRASSRKDGFTPDETLAVVTVPVTAGAGQKVKADFSGVMLCENRYLFACLMANPGVAVKTSVRRLTGVLALNHGDTQSSEQDIGVERIEFWRPLRRPSGHNLCVDIEPPLDVFRAENVTNGVHRPTSRANAWIADIDDPKPSITLAWPNPQAISKVVLSWDSDIDHPMESVLFGHPESAMPFCVRDYRVLDDQGNDLADIHDNHQTRNILQFAKPVRTRRLTIQCGRTWGEPDVPATLFGIQCYSDNRSSRSAVEAS